MTVHENLSPQAKLVPKYQVNVYCARKLECELMLDHPISIGRRDLKLDDPAPIALNKRPDETRLVVAESNTQGIPRLWFRLSSGDDGRVVVENLHSLYEVALQDKAVVAAGQSYSSSDEVLIDLGFEISLRVTPVTSSPPASDSGYRHLETIPPMPGREIAFDAVMSLRQLPNTSGKAAVDMLRVALQVVQNAAGSDAFFQKAVSATTQIVELERAMVLMRSDAAGAEEIPMSCAMPGGWCTVAEFLAPGIDPSHCPAVSSSILARVSRNGISTVIHDSGRQDTGSDYSASLQGIHCVVASPILNTAGELIGVLYGDRWTQQGNHKQARITELEATLVEVLAGAVAGGIARKSEERRRGNLSGFFSPRVAELLASSPELLAGQDVEISVLFCDIRGFSSVTEKLGPRKTIEWINDVLSELSQCVVDTDGVLVDYVGDELMAMWGAPGEQTDHAKRAVDSAIAMLDAIETLRVRWADMLPAKFGAGIGVNTGPARVGNVGSKWKFKYGVLGQTVNVGSRLQAATKQVGVDCLISQQTAIDAGCVNQARRIAKLAVVGIEESTHVYQLVHQPEPTWDLLKREYEAALLDFEEQRFGEATRRLGALIQSYPEDRPCRQLLARAADQLNDPSGEFSAVWRLTKK